MVESSGDRWFKITVVISSGFFAGFSIANAIYYNRIRTGACSAITQGEATTLLWINIILAVLAIIIFFWALWLLIFTAEVRTSISNQAVQYAAGNQGYVSQPPPQQPVYQQSYPAPAPVPLAPGQLVTTSGAASANAVPASFLQQAASGQQF